MILRRFTMMDDMVNRVEKVVSGSTLGISSGVGRGTPPACRNLPEDVRAIQQALNRFPKRDGGANPALVVDGNCGPKTRAAIDHFQAKQGIFVKGTRNTDGIIEPGKNSIARLRDGPGPISDLPAEFASRIPNVINKITAASALMLLATVRLNMPSGLGGSKIPDVVEKHFKLSQWKSISQRGAAIARVQSVFQFMQTAIGHIPQGRLLALDEPPDHALGSFMFTFAGGFHDALNTKAENGLPIGSIYLCPRARTLNGPRFVYCMIHELAHFVGPQDGSTNLIDDLAYFHKNPQKYKLLLADQTLRNADSYSQFAFEATGEPDFRVG